MNIVTEVRQVQSSANFAKIEGIEAQSCWSDDGLLSGCGIDSCKPAEIAAASY